jgi:hypothetical protein
MPLRFAVTWDYRCPFARNAHEHVVAALEAGADWDVTFLPFSLGQAHVAEGEPDVWDLPDGDSGLLAQEVALAVQAVAPERFLGVHGALFRFRHELGGNLRDRARLTQVLTEQGVDAGAVWAEVDSGRPREQVRELHTTYAKSHDVWGVPTFIVDDQAAFVRLMHRPNGDAEASRRDIERVVTLLSWPELNEFKHTSIPN